MSNITQAAIDIAVPEGTTSTDCRGVVFTVEKVQFRAHDFGVHATAYGMGAAGKRTNASWSAQYDELPDWFPAPPAEFTALAQRIAGGEGK